MIVNIQVPVSHAPGLFATRFFDVDHLPPILVRPHIWTNKALADCSIFQTSVNRLFDGTKEGLECQVSPQVEVQSMNTLLEDLVSRDAILAELACIVSDPGPVFC